MNWFFLQWIGLVVLIPIVWERVPARIFFLLLSMVALIRNLAL